MDICSHLAYVVECENAVHVEESAMDMGQIIFSVYFFGAIIVGVYLIREVEFGEDVLIKKKDRRLGPAYWGLYEGSGQESETMQIIEPPKPTKDVDGVAGGASYARGSAVKSARS